MKRSNFTLIAGPCLYENEADLSLIAKTIALIGKGLDIDVFLKASYRKANRREATAFRGIGDIKALKNITRIGEEFNLKTITDIHSAHEAEIAGRFVDIIQIPAFLSRQSDIIEAAAKTGKAINIKKGQFMNSNDLYNAVHKAAKAGAGNIYVTERGTMFGDSDLVVDMRNILRLKTAGCPVLIDVVHSLGIHAGNPDMINLMAMAGIAAGADGIYIEVHPKPERALSDSTRMYPLEYLSELVSKLLRIKSAL